MSVKRALSPESYNNNIIDSDSSQLKRLKLHSIIQELRNEEANLVVLKKLHSSQQLLTRAKKTATAKITHDFRSTPAARATTPLTKPAPLLIANVIRQEQSVPTTSRRTPSSVFSMNSNRVPSTHRIEEARNQAKAVLRKQLEHSLLNIPLPKPSLRDIILIPNGTSVDYQAMIGFEDVIQCLTELHSDRHRVPQRFTDQAQIHEPYICDQCGTDLTIRWWKHINSKSSSHRLNILCDRCKKQDSRRTSKSEHSTLLKNVFVSAIDQEKEIEKHFHVLMKKERNAARSLSKSSTTSMPTPSYPPATNHQHQSPQTSHFATKLSQQPTLATRKSNGNIQSSLNPSTVKHGNHTRTVRHNKPLIPNHAQQQQRSKITYPQQTKANLMVKTHKNGLKRQSTMSSSLSTLPSTPDFINAYLSSNLLKATATKRQTFPIIELQ